MHTLDFYFFYRGNRVTEGIAVVMTICNVEPVILAHVPNIIIIFYKSAQLSTFGKNLYAHIYCTAHHEG